MADNLTPFSKQAEILADLWLNWRDDPDFADFMEYNDIGLPLAYAVAQNVAEVNELGQQLVEETFDLLLSGLGIEDTGFDSLEEMLDTATDDFDE